MRYLVTGGAGFVGSNLVDKLLEQDHEVEVWDTLATGKIQNVNANAKFRTIDVAAPSAIAYAVKEGDKFDAIFHMAALARIQPSFAQPRVTHQTNVTGTLNMLLLAKEQPGCRFVYPGSSSVYHDPYCNPYSFTKWQGEEYCKMFNQIWKIPCSICRFFNVYGPRHLAEGMYATVIAIFEKQKAEDKNLTVTGTGQKRRDFTHVDDITDGLIAASQEDWNCEIFDFGSGVNHSIMETAMMFEPTGINMIRDRPGEAETTLADISFSRDKLGYDPKWSLEQYVKLFVQGLDTPTQ